MNQNIWHNIKHHYSTNQIIQSVLVGFMFFLLPTVLIVTLYVNIILLYMPYFLIAYMVLYIFVYGFLRLGIYGMIQTCKTFTNNKTIDYNGISTTLSRVLGTIILAIFILIYWIIFY